MIRETNNTEEPVKKGEKLSTTTGWWGRGGGNVACNGPPMTTAMKSSPIRSILDQNGRRNVDLCSEI